MNGKQLVGRATKFSVSKSLYGIMGPSDGVQLLFYLGHALAFRIDDVTQKTVGQSSLEADVSNIKRGPTMCWISG